MLVEEAWRHFVTQRGEEVLHERFDDFVAQLPLRRLGADLALVLRVIGSDMKTLGLRERTLAGSESSGGDRRSTG